MSKISTTVVFFTGAIIGGAVAWYYAKQMYADLAEQEIASVKEAFSKREQQTEQDTPKVEPTKTILAAQKVQEKESVTEYVKTVEQIKKAAAAHTDTPYVIPPEEFGEIEEYSKISLIYFEDGILSDEYGVIIDDVEDAVGDALEHFGEYEDDSVFVRSDARRSDYEILRDLRTYTEFRKTLPPNI